MINSRHNGKEDLFQEIKYRSRCKLLQIEPSHTCTNREYVENLHLSQRDVTKWLNELKNEGRIKLDKIHSPKFKRLPRKRYAYTAIDKKFFESKDEIQEIWNTINGYLDSMRKTGTKMKDRPAMKSIRLIRIPTKSFIVALDSMGKEENTTRQQGYELRYHGKYDKIGHEYLEDFCTIVNTTFSFIDSMTYSVLSNVLDSDEKTVKVIEEIRIKTVNEITDVIGYIFESYEEKLRKAIYDIMLPRIPTYFMMVQLDRRSKVRT